MAEDKLDSIYNKLLIITQHMHQNLEVQARSLGYNISEFLIMIDIITHQGTDLNGVCERLGMKKSAASKIVQKLVERGKVSRKHPHDDRRKIALSIVDEATLGSVCRKTAIKQTFAGYESLPCNLNEVDDSLDRVLEMLSE